MQFEDGIFIKDYIKMMAYMIVLCSTLAISLSFWVLSITASTYYGESSLSHALELLSRICIHEGCV